MKGGPMKEQTEGLHIQKEGTPERGIHYSVSGKLGDHQYWRMGPFSTEELAQDYIKATTKGGRKLIEEDITDEE